MVALAPAPAGAHGRSSQIDPQVPGSVTHHTAAVSGGSSPWVALAHAAPLHPGTMLLLTNGDVLVQDQGAKESGTGNWWVLKPNDKGSYIEGTWSKLASLPSGYAPYAFASAVLPDGRVIIEGGEENNGKYVWANKGAIYDPVTNVWTSVAPPTGSSEWSRIGDAPSTVLANGKFMLGASGYSGTTVEAILNATTLTWKATGTGKDDGNDEEGWTLLPDGDVLTVDTHPTTPQGTEIYSPATGAWSYAGSTPDELIDETGEVGPQALMPDGDVLATGATGDNALYNTSTGKWSSAPSFPVIGGQQYDEADGPAAVLSDGSVLLDASPGDYNMPVQFFVYNGKTMKEITNPPNAADQSSYFGYMLVLPTGQVLFNDRAGQMEVYTAGGTPKASWLPTITSVASTLAAGGTYTVSGKQLNGLTEGASYGDDFQDNTNYPLVRITNDATGDVFYAKTFGMTSMSVTPNKASSAQFTLPSDIEAGNSSLVVVASGFASAPFSVTITSGAS